jgi:hypothetical protein
MGSAQSAPTDTWGASIPIASTVRRENNECGGVYRIDWTCYCHDCRNG